MRLTCWYLGSVYIMWADRNHLAILEGKWALSSINMSECARVGIRYLIQSKEHNRGFVVDKESIIPGDHAVGVKMSLQVQYG